MTHQSLRPFGITTALLLGALHTLACSSSPTPNEDDARRDNGSNDADSGAVTAAESSDAESSDSESSDTESTSAESSDAEPSSADSGVPGQDPIAPLPGDEVSGIVPLPSPVDASCSTVLDGPYSDELKVPEDVVVSGDDYTARVQWGGDLTGNGASDDDVEGYRICWGPADEAPKYGVLTTERVGQLYSVQNGEPFVAYVQSVDGLGNVSRPSPAVEFSGDPTRVNALRARMTAFFDDFNTPSQPVDELRWNVAYSFCNDPVVQGTFVSELHAINMIGNHSFLPGGKAGCDRTQNISRAREVFDFTDREGLITFDFDGTDGDRSTWYVDVFPYEGNASDRIDITGHATFDPGTGHPGRFLRFSQSGNLYMINRYEATGAPGEVFKADIPYTFPNVRVVEGVMRHWELRVSKDYASITIDGQLVLEAPNLGLDFEKSIVTWDQFNYNPAKIGRPWVVVAWDNFGFDGPRSAPVVHNYKVRLDGADGVALGYANPEGQPDRSTAIEIPDDVSGAETAYLFYTLQNNNYTWTDTDSFALNGETFPMSEPVSPTGITLSSPLIDDYRAFTVVEEIPVELLQQGSNPIDLHAELSLVRNIHIELEFGDDAPPYTQPFDFLSGPAIPEVPLIGPSSIVTRINDRVNQLFGDASTSLRLSPTDVSGTATIALLVDNYRPLWASGKNFGVSRGELWIDQEVFATVETNAASPAPGNAELVFTVDTTQLSNGPHEVFGVAYDAAGTKGRPGYPDPERDENGVNPEHYAPVIINVSN